MIREHAFFMFKVTYRCHQWVNDMNDIDHGGFTDTTKWVTEEKLYNVIAKHESVARAKVHEAFKPLYGHHDVKEEILSEHRINAVLIEPTW